MTVIKTLDIFCDGDDCHSWVHGVVGRRVYVHRARHEALQKGWALKVIDGKQVDLCPDCLAKTKVNMSRNLAYKMGEDE